jgi:hypothetical protein
MLVFLLLLLSSSVRSSPCPQFSFLATITTVPRDSPPMLDHKGQREAEKLTILGQHFTGLHVLHEVFLFLVDAGREAVLLGSVDGGVDILPLVLSLGNGHLLLDARLSSFLAAQLAAEFGGRSALDVKPDDICCGLLFSHSRSQLGGLEHRAGQV